ncbi:phosphoribosyl-AMP cyclohydrolase [Prosthecomicrobium hirschii]|uniref:Phosphoribosyl-AMP cyclohydrolase n=1 Tax=Prosthecodimorpha hirschii TaxID=665126 RepID=A0A0P6WAM6_9HYPH|nr:phosphoribosyl-AMP cyclohydrolase [Prosthecomicrobium hirschii]KPL51590.1 phosphoribosyl-AMP cyclohydrolase [Prosthecomicrobium hirschii]
MTDATPRSFPAPGDHDALELGTQLTPRFDAAGLVTAVVTDVVSGEVLMLAHMNAEALARTIETGIATYWSRSRRSLWVKGETSGNRQHVAELRVDCDQDAVWLKVRVEGHGASCHRGYRSCFYRAVPVGGPADAPLAFVEADPAFDPADVYGSACGHTHS